MNALIGGAMQAKCTHLQVTRASDRDVRQRIFTHRKIGAEIIEHYAEQLGF
jgi:hypothetical protein